MNGKMLNKIFILRTEWRTGWKGVECARIAAESVYAGVAGRCDVMPFENASIKSCTATLAVNPIFCTVMSAEASGISRLELRSSIIAHFTIKLIYCVKKRKCLEK